jgi:hypothetical protein
MWWPADVRAHRTRGLLATAENLSWLNTRRLHGLGGIPPAEHETTCNAQDQPIPGWTRHLEYARNPA